MELMNQFNAPKLQDAIIFLKCRVENLQNGLVYQRADVYVTDYWIFIEYNSAVDILSRNELYALRITNTER